MSLVIFRLVLVSEMGSLGSVTADTRFRSLVVDRIRYLRIIGCLSLIESGENGTAAGEG